MTTKPSTTKPSTSAKQTAMRRLDRLVGDWDMRASIHGRPTGSGRTTFDRLEGGAFLIQHADATPGDAVSPEWVANSPFPVTAGSDSMTRARRSA